MPDAATVLAIYRFRPDVTDTTISDLLSRHRTALEKSGLVTSKMPTVMRSTQNGTEHKDFIEIFEWTHAGAPAAAHSDAGVSKIWQEFEGLTKAPVVTLGQLAEASHPWPHFAPFAVTYASVQAKTASPKASKAPKTKRAPAPAKKVAAPKRPAPRAKRPTPKARAAKTMRGKKKMASRR